MEDTTTRSKILVVSAEPSRTELLMGLLSQNGHRWRR